MIKSRMAQRGQGGFTLIELLVVVAILAILIGVAVVGVGAMRDNANKSACKADKDTIETAALAQDVSANVQVTSAGPLVASNLLKKVKDAGGWTISWTNNEPTASYPTAGAYGTQTC